MFKKSLFTVAVILGGMTLLSGVGLCEEAVAAMASTGAGHNKATVGAALALAVGFGFAMAVMAGAIGQSRAATAALEGIARNPGAASKVQTPMIIGMALIESLILFAFAVSFILQGKI